MEWHELKYEFTEIQNLFVEHFMKGKQRELDLKMSKGEMEKSTGN